MIQNVLIIGDGAFAEVAYEYFTHDSNYEVVGFAVERAHLKRDTLFGLPVIAWEDAEHRFPPGTCDVYAAIVFNQMNRLRARFVAEAQARGYGLASYVSSRAFVWPNVTLGEHCFIFEDNTVQPFVMIGDNVVLWSGNHVGHHARISNHVFVSSHVVLSGASHVGEYAFMGVNSTVANDVRVAKDCWIGPGVMIAKDTEEAKIYRARTVDPATISSLRYFKVPEPTI
tara:strand:+ start:61013 stop:61693 length:681 start_codon:yes stop_codon:yes gene_type:complete